MLDIPTVQFWRCNRSSTDQLSSFFSPSKFFRSAAASILSDSNALAARIRALVVTAQLFPWENDEHDTHSVDLASWLPAGNPDAAAEAAARQGAEAQAILVELWGRRMAVHGAMQVSAPPSLASTAAMPLSFTPCLNPRPSCCEWLSGNPLEDASEKRAVAAASLLPIVTALFATRLQVAEEMYSGVESALMAQYSGACSALGRPAVPWWKVLRPFPASYGPRTKCRLRQPSPPRLEGAHCIIG